MNGDRPPPSVLEQVEPLDIAARPHTARAPGFAMWGGGEGGAGAVALLAPPTVWKPQGAIDFNRFGTLTARTSANTPALFTPDADFQVPPGNVGVIRSVSILANSLLVTSDIRWTLLFNATGAAGWTGLTINPRAAGSVEVSWTDGETYIVTPEGALIQWSVRVNDAGTYQVSVAYHGWFYPVSLGYLR